MDLDINMRTVDCFYTVTFYGALFREVGSVSAHLLPTNHYCHATATVCSCWDLGYRGATLSSLSPKTA